MFGMRQLKAKHSNYNRLLNFLFKKVSESHSCFMKPPECLHRDLDAWTQGPFLTFSEIITCGYPIFDLWQPCAGGCQTQPVSPLKGKGRYHLTLSPSEHLHSLVPGSLWGLFRHYVLCVGDKWWTTLIMTSQTVRLLTKGKVTPSTASSPACLPSQQRANRISHCRQREPRWQPQISLGINSQTSSLVSRLQARGEEKRGAILQNLH